MLFLWYTPSDDLVRIVFEKVWLFPKEEPYLSEEAISILLRPFRGYLSCGKVIDDVSVPCSLKVARMCSSGNPH